MQSNVPVTCLNEDKNGKMSVEINEIELCRSRVHVLNGRVDLCGEDCGFYISKLL